MPYSTQWTDKNHQVTFTGKVTGQEILEMVSGVYGDERFDDVRYNLVDFTGAESFEVKEREIKEIAYMDRAAARSNPQMKLAIAANNDVMQKMSQLYAEYSNDSSWQVRIFSTLEEAKQWLGTKA
jgi:hypothetical protein